MLILDPAIGPYIEPKFLFVCFYMRFYMNGIFNPFFRQKEGNCWVGSANTVSFVREQELFGIKSDSIIIIDCLYLSAIYAKTFCFCEFLIKALFIILYYSVNFVYIKYGNM